MSFHMDKEVNSSIIRLLDALCEFERGSGRRSTLILIPHNNEEEILIAQDGKPLQHGVTTKEKDLEMMVQLALRERHERGKRR